MNKQTYESERRRILADERYPLALKQWMLEELRKMYEEGETKVKEVG